MMDRNNLGSKYELLPPEAWHFYKLNPVLFIEQMILKPHTEKRGVNLYLSDQQKQTIQSIGTDLRVSVVSGKGIGKSFLLACIAIWFASVFEEAKIVLTAPSSKTLRSGLWVEIKKWIHGSYVEGMFTMTSEKLYVDTEQIDGSYGSYIEMRTATKGAPEAMAGIHSPNLLLMADEASCVDDEILRVLQQTLTSGENNKMIMTSNGTRNSGFFYDSHMDDPANIWTKYRFSAEDSPFTSKESILDAELKYGRDSNLFLVDVLGKFATADPDSFFNASDVFAAFDRDVNPIGTDEIEIGVDVARFGNDKTVIFWRHGFKVFPPVERGKTSTVEVTQMVYDLVIKIRLQTGYKDSIRVKVDDTGVGGGVTDLLELDRDHGLDIVPCNFGGKGDDIYANEASVMWGTVRDSISMISLPSEDECENYTHAKNLREELTARRVDYGSGKVKIEPKGNFKKEFGRSPDYADALVLCFARKKNQRSFLTEFDHLSDQFVTKSMNYMGNLDHYVSVHYTSDRQASVVWAYWGNGTLYIVNESVTDDSVARVASEIQNKSPIEPKKILGNDRCFGSTTQDIRAQLRKYRVRMRENFKYDELGALELLNQLVSTKSIKLIKDCQNTIHQMDRWNSDTKRAQAEKDFGLCYAILNIVSELKNKISPAVRPQVSRTPYSGAAEQADKPTFNKALLW